MADERAELPLALTIGDPAGIGPEICAKLFADGLPAPAFVVGDAGVLSRAVRGLGLARLPDFAVREAIEAGRLVTLFDNEIRSDLQVQALFPRSQRMPAKTRLLLNFLAQRLAAGGQASGAGEAEGEAGDGRTADAVAVAPAHEPARTERASRAQRRT